jgi:hypothetical protein
MLVTFFNDSAGTAIANIETQSAALSVEFINTFEGPGENLIDNQIAEPDIPNLERIDLNHRIFVKQMVNFFITNNFTMNEIVQNDIQAGVHSFTHLPDTIDKMELVQPLDIDAVRASERKYFSFNDNINEIINDSVSSKHKVNNLEAQITNIKPNNKNKTLAKIDYWQTVYSIESKQGKLLYRPRNKSRSCTYTTSPCGHHQLSVSALKDIGCKSLQCRKDRLNYAKSLKMSKKLLAKNEERLEKNGYTNLEDYQRYLIHQQGASGIKTIIAASNGEKLLSKRLKRNMASNSPFSYRQLKRMGSKLAAIRFLQHWENKWENEKRLIAGIQIASIDKTAEPHTIPKFSDYDIKLALNYRF